jgi:hypothetical protein
MGRPATDLSGRRREPVRLGAVVPLGILSLLAGCGANRVVPESGAALVRITVSEPVAPPAPDELRVWVYDDGGRLWDGVRVPDKGALGMESAGSYGTLLIQPGAIHGALRIHVRALAAGARVMDGVVSIAEALRGKETVELRLAPATLPDGDGDDVPDSLDDCLAVANPAQGGCAASDAGAAADADAAAVDGGGGDAASPDAPARDGGTPDAGADGNPDANATSADAGGTTDACADMCGTLPPRDKLIGQACTSAGQCISGFCTDGVCCLSACGDPCQGCSTGLCLPVKQANDAPECTGAMTCNKKGDCVSV